MPIPQMPDTCVADKCGLPSRVGKFTCAVHEDETTWHMARKLESLERELVDYKKAAADQLHFDMKAIISGTPEERMRIALSRSEERCKRLEKAVRRALPYLVNCIHEIACDVGGNNGAHGDNEKCPAETEDVHVREFLAALATEGDDK